MSGKMHKVLSGLAIVDTHRKISSVDYSETRVYFNDLSEDFIKYYLDNNHFEGYAGGYAIQGIFSLVVNKIIGSYTNVVGLPMELLYKNLNKLVKKEYN